MKNKKMQLPTTNYQVLVLGTWFFFCWQKLKFTYTTYTSRF